MTVAKLLRRYPVTAPYVLVFVVVLILVGLHPW